MENVQDICDDLNQALNKAVIDLNPCPPVVIINPSIVMLQSDLETMSFKNDTSEESNGDNRTVSAPPYPPSSDLQESHVLRLKQLCDQLSAISKEIEDVQKLIRGSHHD